MAAPLSSREPAPDLARGAMLLLIAIANAHTFLYGHQLGIRGYPLATSVAQQIVTLVQLLLVDGRAYPLFAMLVGYGLATLARRVRAQGSSPGEVARLLLRRGAGLFLIGALHGLLLFSGDIVAAYGLLTIVLAVPIVFEIRAVLVQMALLGLVLVGWMSRATGVPAAPGQTAEVPSRAATDLVQAAVLRVGEWPDAGLVAQAFAVVGGVAIGALLVGYGYLRDPATHRRALRWTATVGLLVAVLGGLPLALVAVGAWQPASDAAETAIGVVHGLSGCAGAVGYLAAAALLSTHTMAHTLRALGQRSLSGYIAQSVLFTALFAPYLGGLGGVVDIVGCTAIAAAVWATTLVAAQVADRMGVRGPAEVVLRSVTYGRARFLTASAQR